MKLETKQDLKFLASLVMILSFWFSTMLLIMALFCWQTVAMLVFGISTMLTGGAANLALKNHWV